MNKLIQGFIATAVWFKSFFEGEEGRPSMTRLLCFMAFFPASKSLNEHFSEVVYGAYLTAFVVQYVGGKWADVMAKPRPAPIIPVPPAATTINVNPADSGNVKPSKVENMDLEAQNVNINNKQV